MNTSPCLDPRGDGEPCDLAYRNKNNDRCRDCTLRVERVRSLGALSSSVPEHLTDYTSGKDLRMEVPEWKTLSEAGYGVNMEDQKPFDAAEEIDRMIEAACREFGFRKEDLFDKSVAQQKLRPLRQKIIFALDEKGLKKQKIARLVGLSYQSMFNYFAKYASKKIVPKKSEASIDKKAAEPADDKITITITITLPTIMLDAVRIISAKARSDV